MNSECLMASGVGRFSCPNLDELNFSYLMMALKASLGSKAMYLSSSCREYRTSTDGSRAMSCNHIVEIVGRAAAG